jgi:Asp-tRNA(Asn)/Glu-tRNA(Gln) amidotransferase A subunit family amidase
MIGDPVSAPSDLSACEAKRLIEARDLAPLELLDSCIARIEALNPLINAVVADNFERAREEAKAAGERAAKGRALGSLDGVPVGIEDTAETEALCTTYGSRIYAQHVPDYDEHVVRALRDAGAIVVAKTNTAEFGAGAHTSNKVYGVTRNPFDSRRSCAGPSGGSAAAVATGMLPLCTASDQSGSLAAPAAFCGVAALRPTPGVVPSDRRVVGMSTLGVQGPMARSVADLALMLSAMAGAGGGDPLTGVGADPGRAPPDLGGLRVAASVDLGSAEVDEQIGKLFRTRVDELAPVFGRLEWRDPDIRYSSYAFWYLSGMHVLAAHRDHFKHHYDALGMNVVTHYEAAMHMDPEQIGWAVAEQTRIYRQFCAFFRDFDLLICPTTAVTPFPTELPYCTHINGDRADSYLQWIDLTAGVSLTGHPVVQLPCGVDHTGMPLGIQLIGSRRCADRLLLDVAALLEAHMQSVPALARPVVDAAALGEQASRVPPN